MNLRLLAPRCESGTQSDASWDRGEPFKFALGGGRAVKGMDRGVRGMRAGGRPPTRVPGRCGVSARSPLRRR
ncbi:FKBP-type peptidyl-prolyl cis-trans isomerase [Streptomyces lateritius]|uniref:Peptidyl-prolyl cis-trans isomerase n=1 Tax=Streptomyces lateritius TaxID=67313 RepID=A0ABW6Y7F3_9ACTN